MHHERQARECQEAFMWKLFWNVYHLSKHCWRPSRALHGNVFPDGTCLFQWHNAPYHTVKKCWRHVFRNMTESFILASEFPVSQYFGFSVYRVLCCTCTEKEWKNIQRYRSTASFIACCFSLFHIHTNNSFFGIYSGILSKKETTECWFFFFLDELFLTTIIGLPFLKLHLVSTSSEVNQLHFSDNENIVSLRLAGCFHSFTFEMQP